MVPQNLLFTINFYEQMIEISGHGIQQMYDYYVMFTTVQRPQDIFQTLILSNAVQLLIFKYTKKTTKPISFS